VRIALAEGDADDADVRALLSAAPMAGDLRIALAREPDARIAAGTEGDRHATVLVRDPQSGALLGMGARAVRSVWCNGQRAQLGYLGQLRRASGALPLSTLRLLQAGFAALARTRQGDELPFELTAIVADNRAARRLLERGLPGLPRYSAWCEYSTLIATVPRRAHALPPELARASEQDLPEIVACLQRNLQRFQLAPIWDEAALRSPERCPGLRANDFAIARDPAGRVVACAALWDQRAFKQVVVAGYSPRLARVRPLANLALGALGQPRLPPPGSSLPLAYLSHLAYDAAAESLVPELLRGLRGLAAERGLGYVSFGLCADHPLARTLQRAFRARVYPSVLYLVQAPQLAQGSSPLAALDQRLPHIEVATL